jgi:uncharacterized lipoprotein YddW (UPF0748 family)
VSDKEWSSVFRKLNSVGVEAVLPQIYSSNEALFEIEGYTVKERWLERIIPIAHKEGIQIHAWMWTMPCNDPKIIEMHPEWYVVNKNGESASVAPAYVPYYKFLCPRRPEVRSFVRQRVKTLAGIKDLDGIHLDYVRMPDVILAKGLQPKYDIVQDKEYPEYDYCYCDYCRSEYKSYAGIDPMDLEDPSTDQNWYQFRYNAVNDMVNQYLVPEARKRDKLITAAVFPNWESVRQQWHKWDLDGFLPMLYHGFYNADTDWIGEEVAKAKKRLENDKPVFSGLFMPHLKNDDLISSYAYAKEKGADGFALFAYGNLKDEDYQIISRITGVQVAK